MVRTIVVHDSMQQGYRYELVAKEGKEFDSAFTPDLTPKQMLQLGVFGGKYMTDCRYEFPASWFARAKLSPERKNPKLNYFCNRCFAAAFGVARERVDICRRPSGMVSVVLPVLSGSPNS